MEKINKKIAKYKKQIKNKQKIEKSKHNLHNQQPLLFKSTITN